MTDQLPIGFDIGGTGIKAAPVDLSTGTLAVARTKIETPHPATPAALADAVAEMVQGIDSPGPIGVTLPSVVLHGIVQTASNIDHSWIGVDAAALFEKATGRAVGVVNDADAAGLAEMRFGAGKGHMGVVVLITLGTGIGSGLFVDGELVPNSELGHLPLHEMDAEDWAAESVRERDKLSWKKWAHRLSKYLELVESLLWPELFILGGGVSKDADSFVPLLDVPDASRRRDAPQRRGDRWRRDVRSDELIDNDAMATTLRDRPAFAALSAHHDSITAPICANCSRRTPRAGRDSSRRRPASTSTTPSISSPTRPSRSSSSWRTSRGMPARRDAMFRGDHVNVSEDRAVLHVALRMPRDESLVVDGVDVVAEVHEVLDRMGAFCDAVRSGEWTGHTGRPIRNVVNIGIGGSDLGPVMAYEALRHYSRPRPDVPVRLQRRRDRPRRGGP